MAGPPDNIHPVDLYQYLTTMPRPHRMVDLPRKAPDSDAPVAQVPIWPLREAELLAAQASAATYLHENLKLKWAENEPDLGYKEVFNNAVASEILQRAIRSSKYNEDTQEWEPVLNIPLYKRAADLRAAMTHDEISVMFNEYLLVSRELGPIINDISKVEFEAWIKRLTEGGSRAGLPFLSLGALIDLLNFSVDLIKSLRTELSSVGSLQSNTSTDPNTIPTDEG